MGRYLTRLLLLPAAAVLQQSDSDASAYSDDERPKKKKAASAKKSKPTAVKSETTPKAKSKARRPSITLLESLDLDDDERAERERRGQFGDDGSDRDVTPPSTPLSSNRRVQAERGEGDADGEGEEGAAAASAAAAGAGDGEKKKKREKKKVQPLSSMLPLLLPKASAKPHMLFQLDAAHLGLGDEVGVIGRIKAGADSHTLDLDVRANLYTGRVYACPSLLIVSVSNDGGAQLEGVCNELVECDFDGSELAVSSAAAARHSHLDHLFVDDDDNVNVETAEEKQAKRDKKKNGKRARGADEAAGSDSDGGVPDGVQKKRPKTSSSSKPKKKESTFGGGTRKRTSKSKSGKSSTKKAASKKK